MTAGGWQLWTDYVYRRGYRLQKYSLLESWRLLDETNHRIVSGSRLDCEAELERLVPSESWQLETGPFVVLTHGLLRSSYCMVTLQRDLIARGFAGVIRYSYASTRGTIEEHGAAFAEFVESLPTKSPLSFVGHSMGNIVLRAAVSRWEKDDSRRVRERMHRVVMLGPPNQGAMVARQLSKTGIFELIAGPGAMQLGPNWDAVKDKLGVPPCPFLVIAGDRSGDPLSNPLVEGPSDYLVSVDEAKLEGMSKFMVVPVAHGLMMSNKRVCDATAEFLRA